jgi:hypothetical protein
VRFRSKPIVIEAVRVTAALIAARTNWKALPKWIEDAYENGDLIFLDTVFDIMTLEGWMRAGHGDWIIRGVKGEIYPCKPDIFELMYELEDE